MPSARTTKFRYINTGLDLVEHRVEVGVGGSMGGKIEGGGGGGIYPVMFSYKIHFDSIFPLLHCRCYWSARLSCSRRNWKHLA